MEGTDANSAGVYRRDAEAAAATDGPADIENGTTSLGFPGQHDSGNSPEQQSVATVQYHEHGHADVAAVPS